MNPSASESSDTPMSAARGDDIEQQEHQFQDEDERSDAASPSLYGLEKELSSTRANFTEFLKAQRSLQSRRCVYSSIAQIKTAAPAAPLTPEVGRDGTIRKRTCAAANSTYMTSASANKQPRRTEEEEKTILRLGLLGRRSSTTNVMATNDSAAAISNAITWDKVFHELEAIDEDLSFPRWLRSRHPVLFTGFF
jgi:hypothetical protein